MAKRGGKGGNESKDPRNNLKAQKDYEVKFKKDTKKCTGFLHYDSEEINVDSFRQQKANGASGLQSRCDLCNRLYFAIIRHARAKIVAYTLWSTYKDDNSWIKDCPPSLVKGVNAAINFWKDNPCLLDECNYSHHHSSYRGAVTAINFVWRDLEKGPRKGKVKDNKTGQLYPAPIFMQDLQAWAGPDGKLWKISTQQNVWDWWCDIFPEDTATCSKERNAVEKGVIPAPSPEHPLSDFTWGAGNTLETSQGHSLPGFNQVKASAAFLPRSSNIAGRVYGFLCEGDHIKMAKFSLECKAKGLSLGHFPAPLRWLGKNDPVNGMAQDLQENIAQSDSLYELYMVAKKDPVKATSHVSWQIRELILELGQKKVSFESFTQKVHSEVESYFDLLLQSELEQPHQELLMKDLMKADPGRTKKEYDYRHEKVKRWLAARPASYLLK
jgi:hypothetical protein